MVMVVAVVSQSGAFQLPRVRGRFFASANYSPLVNSVRGERASPLKWPRC